MDRDITTIIRMFRSKFIIGDMIADEILDKWRQSLLEFFISGRLRNLVLRQPCKHGVGT